MFLLLLRDLPGFLFFELLRCCSRIADPEVRCSHLRRMDALPPTEQQKCHRPMTPTDALWHRWVLTLSDDLIHSECGSDMRSWAIGAQLSPRNAQLGSEIQSTEKRQMKNAIINLSSWMKTLVKEEGQDLVEYTLVVAMVAFGATAGEKSLATKLNTAFNGIGTTLNSYVS
jgi:Flp pilus assembly pilin Flp